ncbi:MAG TPA: cupin domain-containing protein [Burkholderiales bacterium]|nr:cupin domain-containing protein [Burkholderiales bacterium]
MKKNFLGGLTEAEFLRRHWQKKPLLARSALREYAGAFAREELFELAQRDDIESRIVQRTRGRWKVDHGPFAPRDLRRLPRSGWTLLVQGVEVALWQAARLLRQFAFLPYARLDDLMVSYAVPGGGVGPHFDSYDVFLLQSAGRRQWRVSAQRELELLRDVPLKILKNFHPDQEWTLAPGDILYLPPRYAHEGIAVDDCITCSVGFRAPASQELASRFLEFLQDRLQLDGQYADRDLAPTRRPARIPAPMVAHTADVLRKLRWSRRDVVEFLGCYLSEPKDNVVFEPPSRPLTRSGFARRVAQKGVRLSAATRMMYYGGAVFINGEAAEPGAGAARVWTSLADARQLDPPLELPADAWESLYAWYLAGYIGPGSTEPTTSDD